MNLGLHSKDDHAVERSWLVSMSWVHKNMDGNGSIGSAGLQLGSY